VNVGLNFVLIPRYGFIGAAWANAVAYALQAGIAFGFSQRFYPVRYEYGRLARVAAAGLFAYLAGRLIPDLPPLAAIAVRAAVVLGVFVGLLRASGFFRPDEMAVLARVRRRAGAPPAAAIATAPPADTTELAGEIISTALPDEQLQPADYRTRR
jgi:hypothetical protein